jgi:hypothetical protein
MTSKPPSSATSTIPRPIVPAPTTPTVGIYLRSPLARLLWGVARRSVARRRAAGEGTARRRARPRRDDVVAPRSGIGELVI